MFLKQTRWQDYLLLTTPSCCCQTGTAKCCLARFAVCTGSRAASWRTPGIDLSWTSGVCRPGGREFAASWARTSTASWSNAPPFRGRRPLPQRPAGDSSPLCTWRIVSVWQSLAADEDQYGIHVQVFRKSKSLWLETTATDNWSLREQNKTGKEMES